MVKSSSNTINPDSNRTEQGHQREQLEDATIRISTDIDHAVR